MSVVSYCSPMTDGRSQVQGELQNFYEVLQSVCLTSNIRRIVLNVVGKIRFLPLKYLLICFLLQHIPNYVETSQCLAWRPVNPSKVKTRQAMYVWRNIVESSCNHWCSGKAIRITCSESVFVALGIQHAMRTRHVFICGLRGSTIFFQIISQTARFSKKMLPDIKCVFWFSLQNLSEKFLILKEIN